MQSVENAMKRLGSSKASRKLYASIGPSGAKKRSLALSLLASRGLSRSGFKRSSPRRPWATSSARVSRACKDEDAVIEPLQHL